MRGHSHSVTRVAIECGSSSRVTAQQLLAHELGHPERLGHVGDHVVGVVAAGPRAGAATRCSTSASTPSPVARRHREVLAQLELAGRRAAARAPASGDAMSTLLTTTTASLRHPRGDAPVAPARAAAVASTTRHTTSTSPMALGGGVVEPLAEQRARLVDAGRVDEHDLGVGPVEHAAHLGAGGLRLVGDDR